MRKENFVALLNNIIDLETVEKIYKHMDYCFIHFYNREMMEIGKRQLEGKYHSFSTIIIVNN